MDQVFQKVDYITDECSKIIDNHLFKQMVLIDNKDGTDTYLVETKEGEYFLAMIINRERIIPKGMLGNIEEVRSKVQDRCFHAGWSVNELANKFFNSKISNAEHLLQQLKY